MAEIKFKASLDLPKKLELSASKQVVGEYIASNLKHQLFEWQQQALQNFLAYQEHKQQLSKNSYTHLMFNLATGSGKTLLMAATMLYYYKQGYRNFLFFVDQNNIINKTEQNLANKYHPKYLFKPDIVIDNKLIEIKKVENFSNCQDGVLEIKFTTIHKFYHDIHNEKENSNTLADLHQKNIVMLADEAHHLNANTKKYQQDLLEKVEKLTENASEDKIEALGWEHCVLDLVLQKNNNAVDNKNVLLEFTATIPNNANVLEKYQDKTIFCFDLKEFLQKGYTKHIILLSAKADKKNRILTALLFNWYRSKIAVQYNVLNFKSVMLLRSKTIAESFADFAEFKALIANLCVEDLLLLKQQTNIHQNKQENLFNTAKSIFDSIWQYVAKQQISLPEMLLEIVNFLQNNFADRNLIITNSANGTKTKEKTTAQQDELLNNLESKDNPITAIFTVDRLTEGWDVLNLFDIVRLYQGQNAGGSNKKTPESTIKEKQLIGRGVRYYPFSYQNHLPNKRKFDDDFSCELSILEKLIYHTYDEESKYISHLSAELAKDGYIDTGKQVIELDFKQQFKDSNFYKIGKVLVNEKVANKNRQKNTIDDIKKATFCLDLSIAYSASQVAEQKLLNNQSSTKQETIAVNQLLDRHIFRKALNKLQNLPFSSLQNEFAIGGIDDLLENRLFGGCKIDLVLNDKDNLADITNQKKLEIAIEFLQWFAGKIKQYSQPYIGSTEFRFSNFCDAFSYPKQKIVEQIFSKENDWYVMEKSFLNEDEKNCLAYLERNFINKIADNKKIYLLRNEEVYKVYNFSNAEGFCPDFMIFIQFACGFCYQVLLEVKGSQFKDADQGFANSQEGWKESFLKALQEQAKYGDKKFADACVPINDKYRIIGLPFYNVDDARKQNNDFANELNRLLDLCR